MASGNDRRRSIESWWRDEALAPSPPVLGPLLSCASVVYRGGRALHRGLFAAQILQRRRLPIPVVSVGNLAVGGVGKTPFVGWLARELVARGRRVLVVARGYGKAFGARLNDEGEWLERAAPGARIVQAPDRFRAATEALAAAPADIALLDDGFQHERLARDLDVVLLDGRAPFGNGRLLPRGPLREPPAALRRARFVLVTRAELAPCGALEQIRARVVALAPAARFGVVSFEIAALRRGSGREPPDALRGRAVVLFTGVGSPESVRANVEQRGATVVDELAFPDHHAFTREELEQARARAAGLSAALVVTEKDAVKLDRFGAPERYLVLEQRVVVADGGRELIAAIEALSSSASP